MGNYLGYMEKCEDYLYGERKIKNLEDVPGVPTRLCESFTRPFLVHASVMYRHIDWSDFVVTLDKQTIDQIKACLNRFDHEKELLDSLKPGMNVIILDGEYMSPVSYNALHTHYGYIEVVTLEEALEKAVDWYIDTITIACDGFESATQYFLMALRLAMLEGDMDNEKRFSEERYQKVWHKVYGSFLYALSQKLRDAAIEYAKGKKYLNFDLDDDEVRTYVRIRNNDKEE